MKVSVVNIREFAGYLCQEKSAATQEKYLRDVRSFWAYQVADVWHPLGLLTKRCKEYRVLGLQKQIHRRYKYR